MAINTSAAGAGIPMPNSSGTGASAVMPDEARGLCWGGFLTPLFWGIGNRTWVVLLALIPYVGLVMPFVILFKGNEWAWRNRQWQDVEQFKRYQRVWAGVGLILNTIAIVLIFAWNA